jgi:Luciferase-like monooxygenase
VPVTGALTCASGRRYPGILAKIITTLNVPSGGRAWLGIGAAWNEEESRGLGIRFVARYAQALARKLEVLRAHCEAEGRDYDEILKTCYFGFDVGRSGERAGQVTDQLAALAEMGFQAAIGAVDRVFEVRPLEVIGGEVIPAVAGL